MTLAHELGHILFPDMDKDEPSDKEYCIMRFAGAFLIPRPAVIDALGLHSFFFFLLLKMSHN